MKVCSRCKTNKHLFEFYSAIRLRKDGTAGLRQPCKSCMSENWSRKYQSGSLEERKAYSLKYVHGLSLDEFKRMHKEQDGKCYICKKDIQGKKIAVDHDHKTGKIRKLLCPKCNAALGMLSDDPQLFLNCVSYLETHAQL